MRVKPEEPAAELARCSLFAGLARCELEAVARLATERVYEANHVVLVQGRPAEHVYVLLSGVVRVLISDHQGGEVTVKIFTGPAVFGEMEALTGTTWIESVEVMRRARLLVFPVAAFEQVLDQWPLVCKRLLRDVCLRFRTSAKNQAHIAFDSVERRLAALVFSYVRVFGVPVAGGVQIMTRLLTQDMLARGVGATRKSIQRTFLEWHRSGLLSKQGQHYLVHDLDKLSELAGEDPPKIDHSIMKVPEDAR